MQPSRRSRIAPFYVMEVMREAAALEAEGTRVLHLEVGQPSTPAPAAVLEAAAAALHGDRLGYTTALGLAELRSRVAAHHRKTSGHDVSDERVVVTTGASAGFTLAMLACFDPGDRIGISEPGYAAYRNIIDALSLELVGVPVDIGTRFVVTPEALDRAGRLDGLVIASPSNPTGTTMTAEELEAVVAWCRSAGVRLIADEIYQGITFGAPAPSVVGRDDSAVVVQSFSKYYSMTGWRIGWNVMPDDLVRPLERLAQNLYIAPPTLSQRAACAAFDAGRELDANVARYHRNRDVLLRGLAAAGIDRVAPADGAFYAWADVSAIGDSGELCRRWLRELHVAATPGVDFDPPRGESYVRFSYSESERDVAEAADRLAGFRP